MMRWIVGSSLQFRFLVIVLAIVLLIYSVYELQNTPVDIYPEVDPPLVEIQTEALGLSAVEMEALITVPLEADMLNGVAWLDQIYSESVAGLSSILLVFEPGTDPIEARQMAQERLTETFALPNVSTPPTMLQPLSATNRVMMVGLSSQDLSLIEMSVLARWNIQPRLMGVPGVANVTIWGMRDWQLQVQVDPERLHAQDVTLQQVIKTTGEALWVSPLSYLEASAPGTSGWIDTPNQRLGIRHVLPISSPQALSQVALADSEGLVLGDVAHIVEDHQPLIGDARLADGPGLLLVIEKIPGTNVLEVTEGVEKALEDMGPGLAGVDIDTTVFRPATYVEQSIDNLSTALLIGAVLVVLGLVAFFFEWRRLLISLMSIALSLIVAALVLYERGMPFNMMILAGLVVALGVIMDDAIIDTDNITRRLRQHRQAASDKSAARIVLEASLETRNPLIFGTLIVLLTVLPVLFLTETSARFMEPFVLSYVAAILTSLAVALIVTPALSLILFPNGSPGRRESPIIPTLERAYNATLTRIVRYPYAALVVVGVALIIGLIGALMLDESLMPSIKQTDLLIAVEAAPGTSRSEMNRLMTLVGDELQTIDGVRNVGSHVGRAITGDQVVSINSGEFWVSIDSSADYDKTVTAIRKTVDNYPGLSREVQTYQPERVSEALQGAEHDIVVRLYGYEFDVLQTQAEAVQESIEGIDGINTALVDPVVYEPQVEIEVDLDVAKDYGLKPGDVRRAATTLLSGLRVGSLYQEQKVFDVVVWGEPNIRNSLTDIRNLMIDTPWGDQVALGDVAKVSIAPTPSVVKRDAVSRFIDINVDVSGRSLGAVAGDIDRELDTVQLPFEYHAEVLGDYADRQAARRATLGAMVVAALGIFLLFQASFSSWRLALIAMLALLTALVGGVLFVIIFSSGTLSIGALLGFFATLAITARNVIALIHRYQNLRPDGEPVESALVLNGARERLAPVLMAMAILALMFLPVVIPGRIAGYEVIQPLAIVILGGLITSVLFTLFAVPTLYLRFAPVLVPETSSSQMGNQPDFESAQS